MSGGHPGRSGGSSGATGYEHPYLYRQVTVFDDAQIERAARHRRFLADHADQIVPRPPGPVRRLLQRMLRRARRR